MKQRFITSVALILAVIPLFFFQSYLVMLMVFVAMVAALELNDLVANKKYPFLIIATIWLILAFGLDFISSGDKVIIAGLGLLVFVLIDILFIEIKFYNISLVYTISLLLGFAFSALIYLYKLDILLVFYVILVNYGSDVGAYLVGSRFGKRKLAPKISPNKTIEGALGGVGFAGVLGIVFGFLFLLEHMSYIKIIIVSLLLPIIAQFGDLFFSSLKRNYNKKDFGSLFPGHGGVLDRIDSLIFSLVFMIIFIRLGFLGVFVWKT